MNIGVTADYHRSPYPFGRGQFCSEPLSSKHVAHYQYLNTYSAYWCTLLNNMHGAIGQVMRVHHPVQSDLA